MIFTSKQPRRTFESQLESHFFDSRVCFKIEGIANHDCTSLEAFQRNCNEKKLYFRVYCTIRLVRVSSWIDYAIQKQFHAVGTSQNSTADLGKKESGHCKKRNWHTPLSDFFYNSAESMADWLPSSDPYRDSNQDRLGFGKIERLFTVPSWHCQLSYGLTENLPKNSRYILPDLKAFVQWQVK